MYTQGHCKSKILLEVGQISCSIHSRSRHAIYSTRPSKLRLEDRRLETLDHPAKIFSQTLKMERNVLGPKAKGFVLQSLYWPHRKRIGRRGFDRKRQVRARQGWLRVCEPAGEEGTCLLREVSEYPPHPHKCNSGAKPCTEHS